MFHRSEVPACAHERKRSQLRKSRHTGATTLLGGSRWPLFFAWKFLIASAAVFHHPGPWLTLGYFLLTGMPEAVTYATSWRLGPPTPADEQPSEPQVTNRPSESLAEGTTMTSTILRITAIRVGRHTEHWATLAQARRRVPAPRNGSPEQDAPADDKPITCDTSHCS